MPYLKYNINYSDHNTITFGISVVDLNVSTNICIICCSLC